MKAGGQFILVSGENLGTSQLSFTVWQKCPFSPFRCLPGDFISSHYTRYIITFMFCGHKLNFFAVKLK